MDTLNSEFFIQNRLKLVKSIKNNGLIIVPGNGLVQRSADTPYRFKQDSNFFYLTGIEEPNSTLVIDISNGQSFVMMPIRTGVHAVFDGTQDIELLKKTSGVDEIIDDKLGWQRLRSSAKQPIYIPQKPVSKLGDMYTNPHRAVVYAKVSRIFGSNLTDLRPNLAMLRVIKSDEELKCIEQAVKITLKSIDDTMKLASSINSEYQFEAELTKNFRYMGAGGHAYTPIIASGKSSCTLHYVDNNSLINNGDILLLDVGAEYNNYAADISRTYVWGGKPTERQQDVINSVYSIQNQLVEYLRPGMYWKDFAKEADRLVGIELVSLGLIKDPNNQSDIRRYFPHAISHFVGLDVHDVGDYTKPLEKGMVITVEPGIYIQQEAIGVRIEDDILITENGAEIIS